MSRFDYLHWYHIYIYMCVGGRVCVCTSILEMLENKNILQIFVWEKHLPPLVCGDRNMFYKNIPVLSIMANLAVKLTACKVPLLLTCLNINKNNTASQQFEFIKCISGYSILYIYICFMSFYRYHGIAISHFLLYDGFIGSFHAEGWIWLWYQIP